MVVWTKTFSEEEPVAEAKEVTVPEKERQTAMKRKSKKAMHAK